MPALNIRTLTRWGLRVTTLSAMIAAIAELTVRDSLVIIRTFWYALPRPLLAIVLFGSALCWIMLKKQRLLTIIMLILSCVVSIQWSSRDFLRQTAAGANHESKTSLLFWNCARPENAEDIERLAMEIRNHDPEIIALVETQSEDSNHENMWTEALASYDVRVLPDGLLIASRYPYRIVGWDVVGDETRIASVQLQLPDDQLLRLVVADLDGNPFISRKPAFDTALARLTSAPEPAVLAGDFNTPRDSVRYESLEKAGYQNAFEIAGTGYAPTWPVGAPLMMLDQIWFRDLTIVRFRKVRTSLSDHEILIVEF